MEPGQSGESPTTEPAQVQVWGDPDEVHRPCRSTADSNCQLNRLAPKMPC